MPSRSDMYREQLEKLRGGWIPQDYEKRILVEEKCIAILSDVHAPYHDERFLAYALEVCRRSGVEAIVWLGDLADMHLFSHFGVTDHSDDMERDLNMLGGIVELAADVVDRQYWSIGNHEERFIRHNNYRLGMTDIARLCGLEALLFSGKLIMSDNPTLDAAGGKVMMTHPKSYGRTPLVVPGQLADKFGQHVISAHAHHAAYGYSPTGNYWCVESGGCFEPSLHKYIQHSVTTHRKWSKGFVLLNGDVPSLFSELDMRKEQERGVA